MRLLKSGILVFSANVLDAGAVLLRNALLARLLTVEQFGVVATFTILLTLADAVQNAGLNRMIVQAPDADQPIVQDTLHTVQLALGLAAALFLLLASWPYAIAMGTPDYVWAYCLVALVPALRGCGHLGILLYQRGYRFGPAASRQLLSQLASLLAIWPAYLWLGDFRVILVCILVQQATGVLVSHLRTPRRFKLAFEPSVMRRAYAFGWPLLLNGMLLFLVFNGDRMIIANQFDHETLGWFSAAFMLTLMPTMLIANSLQSVLLPFMANAQSDPEEFQRNHDIALSLVFVVIVLFVAGVAIVGPLAMLLIFGSKYAPATAYLVPLAIMQGIRLARAGPAISATAKAETKNPLLSNFVRALFIPLALTAALATGDIYLMIGAGIMGEVIAFLSSIVWARKKIRLRSRNAIIDLLVTLPFLACILSVVSFDVTPWIFLPAGALLLFGPRRILMSFRLALHGALRKAT